MVSIVKRKMGQELGLKTEKRKIDKGKDIW